MIGTEDAVYRRIASRDLLAQRYKPTGFHFRHGMVKSRDGRIGVVWCKSLLATQNRQKIEQHNPW